MKARLWFGFWLSSAAALSGQASVGAQVDTDPNVQETPSISLELRGTDIRDALRLVAKQSGVNIILSKAVTPTIISLVNRYLALSNFRIFIIQYRV